jgi:hypothetical protein
MIWKLRSGGELSNVLQDIALMNIDWRTIIWNQFGAAIDTLDDALRACPDEMWTASLWDDPTDRPEYTQFWFLVYHTLRWLDRNLSGDDPEFAPPAPFVPGVLPERPYTKVQLQAYLDHGRQKCKMTIEALTDDAAQRPCRFEWVELSFVELQLYTMRHVQEHAAQLSMLLGQRGGPAPDWVSQARDKAG